MGPCPVSSIRAEFQIRTESQIRTGDVGAMFQTILVPVDLTEKNRPAIQVAVDIARVRRGQVILLHIIEMIAGTTRHGELKAFYDELERRAEGQCQELIAATQVPEVPITCAIRFGERVQGILEFVEENQVDLIIMSSHRVDPSKPTTGWATISYKVAILAPCPVLLVK